MNFTFQQHSTFKQQPVQTANLPVLVDLQRLDLHRICDGQ